MLGQLRSGTARAIVKPGQVFNRIHRDDIAAATLAAMRAPDGVRLTNLADGAPSPASEVLAGVARMLGLPEPPAVAFDKAGLPPGAAGFYAENRRIRADHLAALPGFRLAYPDWRAGYAAILASEGWRRRRLTPKPAPPIGQRRQGPASSTACLATRRGLAGPPVAQPKPPPVLRGRGGCGGPPHPTAAAGQVIAADSKVAERANQSPQEA